MPHASVLVLGAGMTGLAAGRATRGVVLEREHEPGGICTSYYLRPDDDRRHASAPAGNDAYRFETGGGHWIFGGDPEVLATIDAVTPLERHTRRSSVYFPDDDRYAGFPVQYHLADLDPRVARCAIEEMSVPRPGDAATMAEAIESAFGPTLTAHFFAGFQSAYTAGLWTRIAPQDGYKTPIDLDAVRRGSRGEGAPAGYNTTFAYPREGLSTFARRYATGIDVRYGQDVVTIDTAARAVLTRAGERWTADRLVSTLPLDRTLSLAGLDPGERADPATGVMVINAGARRGPRCPDAHWVYVPRSAAGFHRVGFYDNVADHFLPAHARARHDRTSIYIERAFHGERPDAETCEHYVRDALAELECWGWIGAVEVADLSIVDCAYTWSWPGSRWRERALATLEAAGVEPVGRYARWRFQGIADSLRDGLAAGARVPKW